MRTPTAILVLMLAGVQCLAADQPALVFGRGALWLSRLPPVLADATITRHLDTGLTTVFLFTVDCRLPMPQKGAAQVGIRYDPWDEFYRVERLEGGGARTETVLRSASSLRDWWSATTLQVAPAEGAWRTMSGQAKVALQVLPFSQAEQRDAQDWLLRSFRGTDVPPADRSGRGPAAASPASPMREFYGAMLASSIGRRSIISYSWTVPVVVEPR